MWDFSFGESRDRDEEQTDNLSNWLAEGAFQQGLFLWQRGGLRESLRAIPLMWTFLYSSPFGTAADCRGMGLRLLGVDLAFQQRGRPFPFSLLSSTPFQDGSGRPR